MAESTVVPTEHRPHRRRWLWWILAALGAILLVAVVGFVIWGLTPLGPAPEALAAMESDALVTFADAPEGLTFTPAAKEAAAGIVLYPGGHVDHRSYSTLARDLAAAGYLVVVPRMPLSLAVLAPNTADEVIAEHPEVDRWVLGGHSLGGAMASTYLDSHPGAAEGLVLLASYPASGDDLGAEPLAVVSLLGSQDSVVDRATWTSAKVRLPEDTTYTTIEGGNHAQFGSYGEQPGDSPAQISAVRQRAVTVAAVNELLGR